MFASPVRFSNCPHWWAALSRHTRIHARCPDGWARVRDHWSLGRVARNIRTKSDQARGFHRHRRLLLLLGLHNQLLPGQQIPTLECQYLMSIWYASPLYQ